MAGRTIEQGVPLPAFLRRASARRRALLEAQRPRQSRSAASRRSRDASLAVARSHAARADRTERRRQDDAVQPDLRACSRPIAAASLLAGQIDRRPAAVRDRRGRARALVPDHEPVPRRCRSTENLRLAVQARDAVALRRLERRRSATRACRRARAELIRFLGLSGHRARRGGRALVRRAAPARHGPGARAARRACCCSTSRSRASPRRSASASAGLIKRISTGPAGAAGRARHRSRVRARRSRDGDERGQGAGRRHRGRGARQPRRCARSTSASGTAALAATPRGRAERADAPPLLDARPRRCVLRQEPHRASEASLAVHEREIVALLGRNGAGKSTLLKTIIGIVARRGGRIALARRGHRAAVRRGTDRARRRRLRAARARAVRRHERAAQSRARAAQAPRGSGRGVVATTRSSSSFRACAHASTRRRTSCRAASSRWWRSRARCPATSACCCSTSRSRDWRPRSIEELFEAFDRLRDEAVDRDRRAQSRPGAGAGRPGLRARARQRRPSWTGGRAARRSRAAPARALDVSEWNKTAAIIGAGLIGRAWAMVFARAGWRVRLLRPRRRAARRGARAASRRASPSSSRPDSSTTRRRRSARIAPLPSASRTRSRRAQWVQENLPGDRRRQARRVRARSTRTRRADAVLASSTSAIPASQFTEALAGRARCLVAHPVNPPHLVPVVELCGAPWTVAGDRSSARAQSCADVGQVPVRRAARDRRLHPQPAAGRAARRRRCVSSATATFRPTTSTRRSRDGLGLRWSFMGPFATIELNAPGGVADYCARYARLLPPARRRPARRPTCGTATRAARVAAALGAAARRRGARAAHALARPRGCSRSRGTSAIQSDVE